MSLAGKGKYLISILTLFIFLGSEYTFLHHHKIADVKAAGSFPNNVESASSNSAPEDSRPIPTAVLVTDHTASSDTSGSVPQAVPTPTPTSISLPTPTPTVTLSKLQVSISPTPTVPIVSPDCVLRGKNGCGVVGQVAEDVKQVGKAAIDLPRSLGL